MAKKEEKKVVKTEVIEKIIEADKKANCQKVFKVTVHYGNATYTKGTGWDFSEDELKKFGERLEPKNKVQSGDCGCNKL